MVHIPYDALIKRLLDKSGLSQVELDKRLAEKLEEFSGLISKEGAAHIVANELQIPITDIANGPFQIKDLKLGMKGISIAGKVLAKYPVTSFNRNGREGRVASVQFADTTGTTRITFWNDDVIVQERLRENDVVSLSELTVKENRGVLELTGTSKTIIGRNPDGVDTESLVQLTSRRPNAMSQNNIDDANQNNQNAPESNYVSSQPTYRKTIEELSVNDAAADVVGVIVQVFKPASFVIDKQTGKKARIEPGMLPDALHHETRYVMNVVIDDGTQTIRVVFFGNDCQQLIGSVPASIIKENEMEFNNLKTRLLGQHLQVVGRIVKNQLYDRLEIISRSFSFNPDLNKEILFAKQKANLGAQE